ncbi:hypothetical protein JD844_028342 [Phrynosoma platyrhinos]|uniref:Uncharacterized protein n=1 Tax=Phrynosoma platyrhinos TaxID=52577 RepID=A0ABQ7SHU5_PHRPL|nr:hypothetical protein JD844_028342 [Phrynosoma platyrhinos]
MKQVSRVYVIGSIRKVNQKIAHLELGLKRYDSSDVLDRSTREIELGLEYGTPVMTLTGQSLKFENGLWITGQMCHKELLEGQISGISIVECDDYCASLCLPESLGGTGDRRETQRLRKRNQQLEEENNLLRLKVDLLLDMLSETTAESHLMEKELEELKNYSRRRK